MIDHDDALPTRLLTAPEVCELLSISAVSLYRWIRLGDFPAAVRLGARAKRWRSDEVQAWIETRDRVACNAASV